MTIRHKAIAKTLLDHGASPNAKSSSGRTAFDFVAPDSEMSFYLHDSGYNIGNAGVTDDFYNPGFSQDRFEEEMAEMETESSLSQASDKLIPRGWKELLLFLVHFRKSGIKAGDCDYATGVRILCLVRILQAGNQNCRIAPCRYAENPAGFAPS